MNAWITERTLVESAVFSQNALFEPFDFRFLEQVTVRKARDHLLRKPVRMVAMALLRAPSR